MRYEITFPSLRNKRRKSLKRVPHSHPQPLFYDRRMFSTSQCATRLVSTLRELIMNNSRSSRNVPQFTFRSGSSSLRLTRVLRNMTLWILWSRQRIFPVVNQWPRHLVEVVVDLKIFVRLCDWFQAIDLHSRGSCWLECPSSVDSRRLTKRPSTWQSLTSDTKKMNSSRKRRSQRSEKVFRRLAINSYLGSLVTSVFALSDLIANVVNLADKKRVNCNHH